MTNKQEKFEKAKMFLDNVLKDEKSRYENINTLMQYKRIARTTNIFNNYSIGAFGVIGGVVATSLITGFTAVPVFAGIILGASLIGLAGSIRAKVKGDGKYAIKRVNSLKQEKELFVANEEATMNYLGDLSLSQINKLGKNVEKQYPEICFDVNHNIVQNMDNLIKDENEQVSEEMYDYLADKGKAISSLIPGTKAHDERIKGKESKIENKARQLEESQKRRRELDDEYGINL